MNNFDIIILGSLAYKTVRHWTFSYWQKTDFSFYSTITKKRPFKIFWRSNKNENFTVQKSQNWYKRLKKPSVPTFIRFYHINDNQSSRKPLLRSEKVIQHRKFKLMLFILTAFCQHNEIQLAHNTGEASNMPGITAIINLLILPLLEP